MKKIVALLVVLMMALAIFAGCATTTAPAAEAEAPAAEAEAAAPAEGEAAAPAEEASKGTIKIGALLDYTGVVAELGPKYKAGIELALEEVGYKVAGYDIELVDYDCASDVATAVEKFKDITEKDGVKLIIGPLMGDAHIAIAPLAAEKDVIITSLVNGMYPTIETSQSHYIQYPTTCEAQTYSLGTYAYETLGYKTVVTVCCNFAGKIAFTDGFTQGFKDAGGEVVDSHLPELGCADYSAYISSMKDADCVFYALNGPAEVSKFVYQYNQSGKTMPLITCSQDADYTPEALAELGDVALGIPGEASYTWQLDNEANKAFVAGIMAKTGVVPTSNEQNAYTLCKALLAALEATGGDDTYAAMWPAITALQMDTPAGKLSFESCGVAVTDMFITEAEKAEDGTYQLSAPKAEVPQIRDWRLGE